MPEYKDIRVHAKTFEALKREKPDGVTWNRYLSLLRENYTVDKVTTNE